MAESASGQYEVNINLKIVKSILFKRVLTLKKAALPKRRLKLFWTASILQLNNYAAQGI